MEANAHTNETLSSAKTASAGGLYRSVPPKVLCSKPAVGRRQTDEPDRPFGGRGYRKPVNSSRPRNIFRIEASVSMATANKHVRLRTTRLIGAISRAHFMGMGS